ncbi:hypothetical protein NP493_8198g00000 [Ridgeia piscesae]|uniref:Uncharacterized protein n=1 Tax=Ridgeia piscesae TaxID=27915 RepID=A0AAD9IP73_RIDPI|nr:hypothetical protein NP493_8198g00000 [Ridgeia piscesae]
MFNGTYIVWCPPMTLGESRDFLVSLQFVNFGAYAGKRVALNRHVWHLGKKTANNKHYTEKYLQINRPDVTTALGARMNRKNAVIWYRTKGRWRVKLANGAHFFSLSTKRMCACVRSMNHLIMKLGLDEFMDSSMKIYTDGLVFLRAKLGIPRSNFIVATQAPFAIHETVSIFDEFAILQPQSEDTICAIHYICAVFDGRDYSVYGDVGIASANLMIAHSCRGHATLVKPCTRQ